MARLKPERVKHALNKLYDWRLSAQSQAAMHLLPLIALLEQGAGEMHEINFEERPHEYEFWNRYFFLGGDTNKPYFNPLSLRRSEKNYPHSNSATIRKNTFALKWNAASIREGGSGEALWTLSENYADIFRDKVLTKGGNLSKVPIVDLAVVLFREETFEDGAGSDSLQDLFRAKFQQRNDDYNKLFSFDAEPSESLFTTEELNLPNDYMSAITDALVSSQSKPSEASVSVGAVAESITDPDDPVLTQVQQLLKLGTSGVILRGAPGTGKTWYAQRLAATLAKDASKDVFRVQFHPSFGYEDFVEGYKPDEVKKSGFSVVPKLFLEACEKAATVGDNFVIMIIDEINRGDPARIFGELLTYLEYGYRNREFILPFSGTRAAIPSNLLIIGTMNPFDRSVAHLDAAFIRRFDHIELEPSSEVVRGFISDSSFDAAQIENIGNWFESAQEILPIGLGHSFFKDVNNIDSLNIVWRHRIRPMGETILEFDPEQRENFLKSFDALLRRLKGGEEE